MKIPTAKKLPSGNWRVQIAINGERHSIVAPTKKEVEKEAATLKAGVKMAKKTAAVITVDSAVGAYIDGKSAVLSPSTIAGYGRIRKNLMVEIAHENIYTIDQAKIQRWVNGLVKAGKTPKTVANAHGLLSAVLSGVRPEFTLRTTLPQKEKHEIQIPSESDMTKIFVACRGTRYEIPIVLAAWLGLRASEIRGLQWDDVDGDVLHIRRAIVEGDNGPAVKSTKTYSGKRNIHLPPYLCQLLDRQESASKYIVNLSGHAMYNGFERICQKAGVPHYRFHDLRHFNASIMLAEGIPDKYGMKRMGHATNNMLKTTYQHTIKEKEQEFDKVIDSKFEALLGS